MAGTRRLRENYGVTKQERRVDRKVIRTDSRLALPKVWQYGSEVNSRALDVHIAWPRQKLDSPQNPRHIQTVRGRGYKFFFMTDTTPHELFQSRACL